MLWVTLVNFRFIAVSINELLKQLEFNTWNIFFSYFFFITFFYAAHSVHISKNFLVTSSTDASSISSTYMGFCKWLKSHNCRVQLIATTHPFLVRPQNPPLVENITKFRVFFIVVKLLVYMQQAPVVILQSWVRLAEKSQTFNW